VEFVSDFEIRISDFKICAAPGDFYKARSTAALEGFFPCSENAFCETHAP